MSEVIIADDTRAVTVRERVLADAKRFVEWWAGPGSTARRWLGPAIVDSYGDAAYRVTLHVYEGSPPRGLVVQLPNGDALATSASGRRRKLFRSHLDPVA